MISDLARRRMGAFVSRASVFQALPFSWDENTNSLSTITSRWSHRGFLLVTTFNAMTLTYNCAQLIRVIHGGVASMGVMESSLIVFLTGLHCMMLIMQLSIFTNRDAVTN